MTAYWDRMGQVSQVAMNAFGGIDDEEAHAAIAALPKTVCGKQVEMFAQKALGEVR